MGLVGKHQLHEHTAPATPTSWIPAAARTHPGEAPSIAERTPLKPGSRASKLTATTTSTASRIPPRISLCLRSPPVGGSGGCSDAADPDAALEDLLSSDVSVSAPREKTTAAAMVPQHGLQTHRRSARAPTRVSLVR